MTKENIDALLEAFDRLELGVGDGNAAHKLQQTRSDAVGSPRSPAQVSKTQRISRP